MTTQLPPTTLHLDAALASVLVAHLRAAIPCEGCGLLATTWADDGTAIAVRFYPGTNLDASPTRFTMAPAEVATALHDIAVNGWSLGAIVHSHPTSPATPSPTDLREACYPAALMLIVSFADASPVLRAWRIGTTPAGRQTAEVPLWIAPPR